MPASSVNNPALRRPGPAGWGALGLVLLAGCSPALDWRDVRVDGPGLQALFPCRPVAQTRTVALGPREVAMHLHACEAAGRTFAVAVADVGEPAAVGPALLFLREAAEAKAAPGRAAAVAASAPASAVAWEAPLGATPQGVAGRWQWVVSAGDERGLDTALFARGTWVVQASVIRPAADKGLSTPFFDGLRFAP